jgi:hypothetical protein
MRYIPAGHPVHRITRDPPARATTGSTSDYSQREPLRRREPLPRASHHARPRSAFLCHPEHSERCRTPAICFFMSSPAQRRIARAREHLPTRAREHHPCASARAITARPSHSASTSHSAVASHYRVLTQRGPESITHARQREPLPPARATTASTPNPRPRYAFLCHPERSEGSRASACTAARSTAWLPAPPDPIEEHKIVVFF